LFSRLHDSYIMTTAVTLDPGSIFTFAVTIHPSYRVNVTELAAATPVIRRGPTFDSYFDLKTGRKPYAIMRVRPLDPIEIRFVAIFDSVGAEGRWELWSEPWDLKYEKGDEGLLRPVSARKKKTEGAGWNWWPFGASGSSSGGAGGRGRNRDGASTSLSQGLLDPNAEENQLR
jgi:hypothetical protein